MYQVIRVLNSGVRKLIMTADKEICENFVYSMPMGNFEIVKDTTKV
jgi:hypothetical protein